MSFNRLNSSTKIFYIANLFEAVWNLASGLDVAIAGRSVSTGND